MPKFNIRKILFSAARAVTAVLLCLAALSGCSALNSQSAAVSPSPIVSPLANAASCAPSISAKAAILIEASSEGVICEKNADVRLPMASTTKIMTALVALENCDKATVVTIPAEAVGIEGSSIYLFEGEKLTLEDLLYAMLLESANDAAAAIAIEVGGSIQGFADMMNAKARELGLSSTHFTNPHGLDDDDHYTTARELAKIAAAAMKNDAFKAIVQAGQKTIPLGDDGTRVLVNHNKLLHRYDGAVGIKTGYTKKSGRCLVSAAKRDGVELIAVTLSAPNDWNDHSTLLDYGFSLCEHRVLCAESEFWQVMPVIGGKAEYVMLKNENSLAITLPKSASEIKCTLELPSFIYAPVIQSQRVGSLVYTLDGKKIAEVPIIAAYSVERKTYKRSILEIFSALIGN